MNVTITETDVLLSIESNLKSDIDAYVGIKHEGDETKRVLTANLHERGRLLKDSFSRALRATSLEPLAFVSLTMTEAGERIVNANADSKTASMKKQTLSTLLCKYFREITGYPIKLKGNNHTGVYTCTLADIVEVSAQSEAKRIYKAMETARDGGKDKQGHGIEPDDVIAALLQVIAEKAENAAAKAAMMDRIKVMLSSSFA